jgi:hypothetical protein
MPRPAVLIEFGADSIAVARCAIVAQSVAERISIEFISK